MTSKGAFELNHIDPAQKSPIYEKLIRREISAAQLDELDKCNLLCRFCHAIWHAQGLRGKGVHTVTLPNGREVKKRIRYHGLLDFQEKELKTYLFTDEPYDPEVYRYSLGTGRDVYHTGFELRKKLGKLLLATRRRRTLRIWDQKGLVFQTEKLDALSLEFECDIRFPLLEFEFETDDPESVRVWVRKGRAIIKGRGVQNTGQVSGIAQYGDIEHAMAEKPGQELV